MPICKTIHLQWFGTTQLERGWDNSPTGLREVGNSHLLLQVRYCVAALESWQDRANLLVAPGIQALVKE